LGASDRPGLAETVGQVTALTLVQRRAVTVAIRHKRTGRPREGSDPGRADPKTGRHRNHPARPTGWRRHPEWSTQASRYGAEVVVAPALCRAAARTPDGRWIHGLPEKFLTTIITVSNAGPSGEPARLMRQLYLRCLITINRPSRRHAIHPAREFHVPQCLSVVVTALRAARLGCALHFLSGPSGTQPRSRRS